jgi:hypothetical protein
MVFELMEMKLQNMLRGTMSYGRRMHKFIEKALEAKDGFEKETKKLEQAIKDGNVDEVDKELLLSIKDVKEMIKSILETEEINLLYMNMQAEEIKQEEAKLIAAGKRIVHLKVTDERHKLLYTDKGQFVPEIQKKYGLHDIHQLQKIIEKNYHEIQQGMKSIHHTLSQTIQSFEIKSRDQRWDHQRIRDIMIGFDWSMQNTSKQSASALKWTGKSFIRSANHAEKDINKMGNVVNIRDEKDLKNLFETMERIKKSLHEESSELQRTIKYTTNIFNFMVDLFFHALQYNEYVKNVGEHLAKEKYPAEHLKKLKDEIAKLQEFLSEKTLHERRLASNIYAKAA